jgi:hypothetical protein
VPTCANDEQLAPLQRSTRYPVTPTLSEEAAHVRLICVLDVVLAASEPGAVGAVWSPDGGSGFWPLPLVVAVQPCKRIASSNGARRDTGISYSFFRGRIMDTTLSVIGYRSRHTGADGRDDATTSGPETSTENIAYKHSALLREYTQHIRKLLSLLLYHKYCKYWFVKSLASISSSENS